MTKKKTEVPPLSFEAFLSTKTGRGRISPRCRLCEVRDRAPAIYREVLRGWSSGMRGQMLSRYLHACGLASLTTAHVDHHFGHQHHAEDRLPEPICDAFERELARAVGGTS